MELSSGKFSSQYSFALRSESAGSCVLPVALWARGLRMWADHAPAEPASRGCSPHPAETPYFAKRRVQPDSTWQAPKRGAAGERRGVGRQNSIRRDRRPCRDARTNQHPLINTCQALLQTARPHGREPALAAPTPRRAPFPSSPRPQDPRPVLLAAGPALRPRLETASDPGPARDCRALAPPRLAALLALALRAITWAGPD